MRACDVHRKRRATSAFTHTPPELGGGGRRADGAPRTARTRGAGLSDGFLLPLLRLTVALLLSSSAKTIK